ncbi:transcription antitermination factor NusB [Abyssalbus ytuae]|uniref:Transcription antitermination factor NusB n=1 Tax=Abyssalbus ytuae TaxID=2926907 RepID=A0A9E6ZZW1_9FLAO|nr:transcription antitermination factor NusB [Abyssalbus ytuae]UOB16986.1 transcription antitermination factor NusB [Abyssalbus ytuae]
MLTRRHIRVKVMQSVYAMLQSQSGDLDKEEKFLNASIADMYNLYLILLSILSEIRKKAEERIFISRKKYLATSEEKNPNVKFINNRLLQLLANNQLLKDELERRKINFWENDDEYVNIILQDIYESDIYKKYMADKNSSFSDDKDFILDIYSHVIATNEKLYDYLEDKKLTWLDDLPLINTMVLKVFKKTKPSSSDDYFMPKLYKDQEDKNFALQLLRKTVLNEEKLQNEIDGKTPNWDTERIAEIDSVLLKMAICEFLHFPSIPVKVTINEYLEIAKEYSTPKSSIFINGILDKLVKEYEDKKMLNKSGRGLM